MSHEYLNKLNWRYATKKYDSSKKISPDVLSDLLQAMRLAPSSFGLTPFRIYHVQSIELRKHIQEKAWGQSQFVDASDLLIFAVPTKLDQSWVDAYFEKIKEVRGMSDEMLHDYKAMVSGYVAAKNHDELTVWASKQAYIALGFLLSAAAQFEIDATPMEGFDAAGVDDVLGLKEEGMTAVVSCALGYRAVDDATQNYAKVRFDLDVLVKEK